MSSQIILNLLTLLLIAQAVGVSSLTGTEKTPYHTSTLSGANYIQEILGSHSPNKRRIYDALRMPETTFLRLVQWVKEKGILHATKKISTEEQLAMFLKIVGEGASNRTTADRFQHSGDTVSRHFNLVLEGLLGLYPEFVTTPTPGIPYEIKRNPKFFPFFKDCLGAADGTHIYAKIKEEDAVQFRNRKGQITQNVLGICKFNLQFTYIYPGWEGSAHDARVLEAALGGDLKVLDGKYYLVDAGYALRKGFLTPYQGVRCHLKEQAQSQQRPENKEELYNLRHAQLRNAIERIFGVLKCRFAILSCIPEYPYETQVNLIFVLTALHNFIRINSPENELENWREEVDIRLSFLFNPERSSPGLVVSQI